MGGGGAARRRRIGGAGRAGEEGTERPARMHRNLPTCIRPRWLTAARRPTSQPRAQPRRPRRQPSPGRHPSKGGRRPPSFSCQPRLPTLSPGPVLLRTLGSDGEPQLPAYTRRSRARGTGCWAAVRAAEAVRPGTRLDEGGGRALLDLLHPPRLRGKGRTLGGTLATDIRGVAASPHLSPRARAARVCCLQAAATRAPSPSLPPTPLRNDIDGPCFMPASRPLPGPCERPAS